MDTMLRAVILAAESLIERHVEVLGRELTPEQDYEVFELRETIKDAEELRGSGVKTYPSRSGGTHPAG